MAGNRWKNVAFEERFFSRVNRNGCCWIWEGSRNQNGYGSVYYGGKRITAHAAAYTHFVGPIPEGLEIDHLCGNPWCVRPEHLEPVTHRENLMRGDTIAARRAAQTHCKRGHEFTEENTVIDGGTRRCRTCKNLIAYRSRHRDIYGHLSIEDVARKMRAEA